MILAIQIKAKMMNAFNMMPVYRQIFSQQPPALTDFQHPCLEVICILRFLTTIIRLNLLKMTNIRKTDSIPCSVTKLTLLNSYKGMSQAFYFSFATHLQHLSHTVSMSPRFCCHGFSMSRLDRRLVTVCLQ